MRRDEWLRRISQREGNDQDEVFETVWKVWRLPNKHTPAKVVGRKLREFLVVITAGVSALLGLKPRRKSRAEMQAEDILGAVGSCQWVAVVHVTGNELGRSEARARHAVRLALDALGMVLSASQALNLRGPGDEKEARHNISLSRFDGFDLNVGHHIDLPHLFSHPPFAEEYLNGTNGLRDQAGWAIDCLLRPTGAIDFPTLKRRWCDALYWFGDARRDASDFSALVRYGICLDVLAKGRKAEGIVNLMADLLGISAEDKFLSDGSSLRSVVTKIYNEGRSQFGHGGRPALLEDLPIDRGVADQVAALALDLFLDRLRAYKSADDVDAFLAAVQALTSTAQSSA